MTLCQSVGHIAVDLNAAVYWAGMHDQTIRLQEFCAFFRQAQSKRMYSRARENILCAGVSCCIRKGSRHGFREHVIDLVRNFDAQFFKLARNESARPTSVMRGAKLE